MKSWAYRIYNKSNGFAYPKFGGAIHSDSMENAVDRIIQVCKINVHKSTDIFGNIHSKFTVDNMEVNLVVYANPDYH